MYGRTFAALEKRIFGRPRIFANPFESREAKIENVARDAVDEDDTVPTGHDDAECNVARVTVGGPRVAVLVTRGPIVPYGPFILSTVRRESESGPPLGNR